MIFTAKKLKKPPIHLRATVPTQYWDLFTHAAPPPPSPNLYSTNPSHSTTTQLSLTSPYVPPKPTAQPYPKEKKKKRSRKRPHKPFDNSDIPASRPAESHPTDPTCPTRRTPRLKYQIPAIATDVDWAFREATAAVQGTTRRWRREEGARAGGYTVVVEHSMKK